MRHPSGDIIDRLKGAHVAVFAACSRPVLPFRPGRPVRVVGDFRSAQRVLGNFRAIRDVHGKAQLVFAGGLDSGSGHHCNVRGRLVGPRPCDWMAHAHRCLLSGILLTLFGVTMAVPLGVKAPLDFAVFSAAGGALLLATCTEFPVSADQLRRGTNK